MLSTNLQHLFTHLQTHTSKSGLFCGSNYYSKNADCQQHAWICGDVVTILENGSRHLNAQGNKPDDVSICQLQRFTSRRITNSSSTRSNSISS
ncbi:hypothetical protein HYQ46_003307 [Verticillium longisporum]|nr:hypothetical protein HYQ46_003307 [Verticillium longisporum]